MIKAGDAIIMTTDEALKILEAIGSTGRREYEELQRQDALTVVLELRRMTREMED